MKVDLPFTCNWLMVARNFLVCDLCIADHAMALPDRNPDQIKWSNRAPLTGE